MSMLDDRLCYMQVMVKHSIINPICKVILPVGDIVVFICGLAFMISDLMYDTSFAHC